MAQSRRPPPLPPLSASADIDDTRSFAPAPGRRRRRRRAHAGTSLSGGAGGAGGGVHLRRRLRRFARFARTLAALPAVASFALAAFVVYVATDPLVVLHPFSVESTLRFAGSGAGIDDPRRDAAQYLKAQAGIGLYALVALLSLVHLRRVLDFHRRSPHFALVLAVLLLGMAWSDAPVAVLTGTVQVGIGTQLAVLFAITRPPDASGLRALCAVLLGALVAVHAAGLVLFVAYGFEPGPFLDGTLRYGGLAGHPNGLGGQCVLGLWAALALVLRHRDGRFLRGLAIAGFVVFGFALATTGSGTAIIATALTVIATLVVHFTYRLSARVRGAAVLGALLLGVVGSGTYALAFTSQDLVEQVAGSVGKDATLTGRTDLWAAAAQAVSERPLLGWSFDDHQTVKAVPEFDIPFNHYHNGFLDTLVNGGALLGALVLYELARFLSMHFSAAGPRRRREPLLLIPFVVLVLLNMSEYSILRPLSLFYVVFQCAWCLLRLQQDAPSAAGRRRR